MTEKLDANEFPWIKKKIQEIIDSSPADRGLSERADYHLKQYAETGHCDMDMWSMSIPIAQFVLPMLKNFREVAVGDNKMGNYCSLKDWDLMIWTFEMMAADKAHWTSDKDGKKIVKGLRLFADNLRGMWC